MSEECEECGRSADHLRDCGSVPIPPRLPEDLGSLRILDMAEFDGRSAPGATTDRVSVCGCEEGENARGELDALRRTFEWLADSLDREAESLSRLKFDLAQGETRAKRDAAASIRSLLNPTQTEPEAESIEEIIPGTRDGLASVSVRGNQ